MDKIRKNLIPYFYFGEQVMRRELYYGGKKVSPNEISNIQPPLRCLFMFLCAFFAIPAILVVFGDNVDAIQKNLYITVLLDLMPPEASQAILSCVIIWQACHSFLLFWAMAKPQHRFSFTAIFIVATETYKNNELNPLNLTLSQQRKLMQFQQRSLQAVAFIVFNICTLAIISFAGQGVITQAWIRHPWISLYWVTSIAVWTVITCAINYAFPVLLTVLIYYLLIKYSEIQRQLGVLTNQMMAKGKQAKRIRWYSRVIRLHFRFGSLAREIDVYSSELRRDLTILIGSWIMLDAYLVYLIIYGHLTVIYQTTLCGALIIHLCTFALLTFNCARITRIGSNFAHSSTLFYEKTNQKQLLNCIIRFKILINLSCFFFLVFKSNNSQK